MYAPWPVMQVGSHVHDVLECLCFVRESETRGDSVHELRHEMIVRLCELMQKMITGPLTGRMFAAPPHDYLDRADLQKSLVAQTAV